jgi:hypothetical protein
MAKNISLIGKQFGSLKVIAQLPSHNGRRMWLCRCVCNIEVPVKTTYLTTGETSSCGCAKRLQDQVNLREQHENKRVEGVLLPLFKGKEPRKDSSTGYRGVSKYYSRNKEIRYRAWITVNGKRYYKVGFETAEEAYYKGRLELEKKYLPKT